MGRLIRFLLRWTQRAVLVVVALWTLIYFIANDELLGKGVSFAVTSSVRGQFNLRRIHYPYLRGLWSALTDAPCRAVGEGFEMIDPDGNLVLRVDGVETDVKLRTLFASLLRSIPNGKITLDLQFSNAHGPRAFAVIAPTRSTWGKTPYEVNIVDTMAGRTPPSAKGSDITIQLDGVTIDQVDFGLGFANGAGQPAWYATLKNAKVHASLLFKTRRDLQTVDGPYFFFAVEPVSAPSGTLVMGGTYKFPLEDIKVSHFGSSMPDRGNLSFNATAKTRGADVVINGALTETFTAGAGIKLDLAATRGGGLLAQLPTPIGGWLSGPATAKVHMEGPFSRVVMDGNVRGVAANIEGIALGNLAAGMHMECGRMELRDVSGETAGGKVDAVLHVQFGDGPKPIVIAGKKVRVKKDVKKVDVTGCPVGDKALWRADLKLHHIDPALVAWIPRSLASDLQGQLEGTLRLGGSLVDHPEIIEISQIDALLDRRVARLLPKRLHLEGGVRFSSTKVQLSELSAKGEGLGVEVTGTVNPKTLAIDAEASVDSSGTNDGWFKRLYSNPRLHSGTLHASGHAGGTLARPDLALAIDVDNWSYLGRHIGPLAAQLGLHDGQILVDNLHGKLAHGEVQGRARFVLFDRGELQRRIADPQMELELGVQKANVPELAGTRLLDGKLGVDFKLSGTLEHPAAAADANIEGFSIDGDPYKKAMFRAELGDGIWHLAELGLERAGIEGGSIAGDASLGNKSALAGNLKIAGIPLSAIPGLHRLPMAISGMISAAIDAHGTTDHPAVSGRINLSGATFRKVTLGAGALQLEPTAKGFSVAGRLFDAFAVKGEIVLTPNLAVHLQLSFADYALGQLIPEMVELAETRGLLSGELQIDFDTAPTPARFAAALRLTKLDFLVAGGNEAEPHRRLAVKNVDDIVVRSDGTRLYIDKAELSSSLGRVKIAGVVDRKDTDVTMNGRLGLELIQYFVRGIFEHTHGDADVDVRVLGALDKPQIFGNVELTNAEVQPRQLEHLIKIPSGRVDFNGERITLTHLKIALDEVESIASGWLRLDGVSPKEIELSLKGGLSAKFLSWVWPDQIGDARGKLDVDLHVTGNPRRPQFRGRADATNMVVELRRLDRELSIERGSLLFSPDGMIVFGCPKLSGNATRGCQTVKGIFDSESTFTVDGKLVWDGEELKNVDVALDLSRYGYATSQYSMLISPNVRVVGNGRSLSLSGRVDVIEGRYSADFNFNDIVFKPRAVERTASFWEGIPLLETMKLDLKVQSAPGTVIVKNNIAELALSAYLDVRGTLAEPRVDGSVQLEEGGTFRPPTVRYEFTTNRGQLNFDGNVPFPAKTPTINLTASAEQIDRNDVAHTIYARVSGLWSEARPELTSPEFDQATIASLLLTGRSPDDARKALAGNDPTVRYSGAASAQGADGLTKSASGLMLSNAISDPLKRTIGLDIASVEFGTKSVDIRLCKRFGRWIKACGSGEIGFLGSSRLDARGELRLLDPLLLLLRVEYLTRGVETLQEVQNRVKLELNYHLPPLY